jgi:hypothetical protein
MTAHPEDAENKRFANADEFLKHLDSLDARTFTATAVASRDDLALHPDVLETVVAAEMARITEDMAKAGYRQQGPWRQTFFWARKDNSTTPHSWRRTFKRLATARVVRISVTGVAK